MTIPNVFTKAERGATDREDDNGQAVATAATGRVFESPIALYPGWFSLPDPDAFSGHDWQAWRKAAEDAAEADPGAAVNLFYCRAGLMLIDSIGQWQIEGLTILGAQGWYDDPSRMSVRFASWVGREIRGYMDDIIDPKA